MEVGFFSPEEWLSSQQVQGLFSRFANQSCQSGRNLKEESDDELNDIITEITCQESELELIHSICQWHFFAARFDCVAIIRPNYCDIPLVLADNPIVF